MISYCSIIVRKCNPCPNTRNSTRLSLRASSARGPPTSAVSLLHHAPTRSKVWETQPYRVTTSFIISFIIWRSGWAPWAKLILRSACTSLPCRLVGYRFPFRSFCEWPFIWGLAGQPQTCKCLLVSWLLVIEGRSLPFRVNECSLGIFVWTLRTVSRLGIGFA